MQSYRTLPEIRHARKQTCLSRVCGGGGELELYKKSQVVFGTAYI